MEFPLDLEIESSIPEHSEIGYDAPRLISEFDLVPKDGLYLGLDISEASSGVTLYENGNKETYNIILESDKDNIYSEVLLRRELSGYLYEVIGGKHLNLIILEDAFQGPNPKTTRILYALNTAIIELILDKKCQCDNLLRVANTVWKSWLYSIDTEGRFVGLKDKVRIQKCLELLGVHEEGKGFQDRLDSTGMLLGYFLEGYKNANKKVYKDFSMKDLCFAYKTDIDFILEEVRNERGEDEVEIHKVKLGKKRVSKEFVVDCIKRNPRPVYIVDEEIVLGAFGQRYDIESLDRFTDKGCFGFWLKKSKYRKV